MTEHPIIFTREEVLAFKAGLKTQARRAMNPQPPGWIERLGYTAFTPKGYIRGRGNFEDKGPGEKFFRCPYGMPGDRLYVSERVRILVDGSQVTVAYVADESIRKCPIPARIKYPEYNGPYKGRVIPREWSRLLLEVTSVRVQRLQSISEADAIAEGMTQERCAAVFDKAAGRVQARPSCWLERDDGGSEDSGDYCDVCVVKQKRRKDQRICGDGDSARESDGPSFCDKCGHPLLLSLTEYGIDRELRIEDDPLGKEPQYFPVTGGDARVVHLIADGIGELQERQLGRLSQIGYATYWDQLHGKRHPWSSNPWVWVVEFKRSEE